MTKKEKLSMISNIYSSTDLFSFIRDSNLDRKSLDKICRLSKCDTLWTDNQIITTFFDTIDSIE